MKEMLRERGKRRDGDDKWDSRGEGSIAWTHVEKGV
jgi:hypothetical protein